ncbi:hypothetical protein [uncultured Tateyamaria sp.]|uniref:hypothetical protein n=1 Tax=uncultured Tateyamaria sp. TaxID=455651 RepID=UPI00260C95A6|nr:hypothetical protein [uncultured Tateyamaria sp.]
MKQIAQLTATFGNHGNQPRPQNAKPSRRKKTRHAPISLRMNDGELIALRKAASGEFFNPRNTYAA